MFVFLFTACGSTRQSQVATSTVTPLSTGLAGQALVLPEGVEQVVYNIMPELSAVTYSVGETLLSDNRFNLAAGITTAVKGSIFIDPKNLQNTTVGTITVDISQFKSNNAQRDQSIREGFLESLKYPLATFQPTLIEGIPAQVQDNQMIALKITGDLTIRQVTRPVTFDVKIIISQETIKGTANASILMSDFGIGPISVPGVVETEDNVGITFTFEAHPTT